MGGGGATDPERGGHLLRRQDRERAGGRLRAEPVRQQPRARPRTRARPRGGRRPAVVHDEVRLRLRLAARTSATLSKLCGLPDHHFDLVLALVVTATAVAAASIALFCRPPPAGPTPPPPVPARAACHRRRLFPTCTAAPACSLAATGTAAAAGGTAARGKGTGVTREGTVAAPGRRRREATRSSPPLRSVLLFCHPHSSGGADGERSTFGKCSTPPASLT